MPVLCAFYVQKKLFANKLVEGLGTIFGGVHISHTRHFWPKGKKYILKNIKKNCAFYVFLDKLGHFRGGSIHELLI